MFGVHAELDELERHAPADRFFLFGHIDDAAAAFADLLEQFVVPDVIAGDFSRRLAAPADIRSSHSGGD